MRPHARTLAIIAAFFAFVACTPRTLAQSGTRIASTRGNASVLVEPYALNIVRVSLSLLPKYVLAAPGYGIIVQPSGKGWQVSSGKDGDVLQSSDLTLTIAPEGPKGPLPETAEFFSESTPYVGLTLRTPTANPC